VKHRILVTNDDGIHAPGLAIAERIAREISDDVWVVAPETEQSGASHSLTLSAPLRLRQISEHRFALSGTPTDCVMMGLAEVMPEKPTLILSGVNRGSNIADDVTYSGTIAGAMEGTALGVPSIALSQSYGFSDAELPRWQCAEAHGANVVKRLLAIGWPEETLININFPDAEPNEIAGIEITEQGRRDMQTATMERRTDLRGHDYYWIGFKRLRSNPDPGTDLRAIYDRKISITPLHLNLTEYKVLEKMRAAFK
jgi:5'-nucleotidase